MAKPRHRHFGHIKLVRRRKEVQLRYSRLLLLDYSRYLVCKEWDADLLPSVLMLDEEEQDVIVYRKTSYIEDVVKAMGDEALGMNEMIKKGGYLSPPDLHGPLLTETVINCAWEIFAVTRQEALVALECLEWNEPQLWQHFQDLYWNKPIALSRFADGLPNDLVA